jgi:hypothetical protein
MPISKLGLRTLGLVDPPYDRWADAIIDHVEMRRITGITAANRRSAGSTGGRTIGIIDRADKSTLRPFGGRCTAARRAMAMARPPFLRSLWQPSAASPPGWALTNADETALSPMMAIILSAQSVSRYGLLNSAQ